MHEIICPHCGKAFKIDEAGYADILKQVRDKEFAQQLHKRLERLRQRREIRAGFHEWTHDREGVIRSGVGGVKCERREEQREPAQEVS